LAAAGIRVGVAVAPVLPFLTDSVAQMRAVYVAAAEAGASYAWHGVLHLDEVARDSYAAFLTEHHPELVEPYAAIYRGKYTNAGYTAAVERRSRSARSGIRFEPPDRIATEPTLVQLSLL